MDTVPFEKEFIRAIEDTVEFLREKDYLKIIQLPYIKGNIFSIINDFSFFIKRKDSLFKSSFLYHFRRWLFNNKDLVILYDFFILNKKETYLKISSILGEERTKNLLKLNILSQDLDGRQDALLRSQVRIIPFNGKYFVSDPLDRTIPDFVWIGSDSFLLAARLKDLNCRGKLVIDIGSGSGIQAITLATDLDTKIIAIDINEKGLRYSKLNAIVNKKDNMYFIKSDMLSAIRGGIDTIISNPPFIFLPPSEKTVNRDGYGGVFGLEKIIYILQNLPQYLKPGGKAILLTLSPVISDKDILMEEVKKLFSENYAIEYKIIDYVYNGRLKNFYDSENISYFIQGILEISKKENHCAVRISVRDIPRIKKLFSFVKIMGRKNFCKNGKSIISI